MYVQNRLDRAPAAPESAFSPSHRPPAADDTLDSLFQAVADATKQAIASSLLRAQTACGARGTTQALPLDRVRRGSRIIASCRRDPIADLASLP
jgi:hypothetical protein